MKKYIFDIVSTIVVLLVIFVIAWNVPFETIKLFISQNQILGGMIFVFMMVLSTVIPPITIFPLIPFVGVVLGPFITMIYSIVGWTIGSVVAFIIARQYGRPFLAKYVSLDKIDEWENKIPENNEFVVLVVLRMITPVDVLSYAMGMFCRICLWKYTLASFIGVIPFSFVLAYGYDIVLLRNKTILFVVGGVLLIAILSLLIVKKKFK